MAIALDEKNFDRFVMIGDRILIKPRSQQDRTRSGLYLPPGVQEKEKIQSGWIIKSGPGYPVPVVNDFDEPWKDQSDQVKYVPLQPKVGDLAVFLQNSGWEVVINNDPYIIVPHSAILMLIRDEGLMT